jgi:hypothetical protein
MHKKFAVLTAAGIALAIACSAPTVAQASAFGPAATHSVAAKQARAAFDTTKAPTVQDLGANGSGNSGRGIQVSGQAVDNTDFIVVVNGVQSLRLQPGADGTAIGTVKTGLRPGHNTIQVRQILMWTGSESTTFGEVSYNYGANDADVAFDATKAPRATSTAVYNDQGRAVLDLAGLAIADSTFVGTVNGGTFEAPVQNGGNGSLVLDGLTAGDNAVSVRQVLSDGTETAAFTTTVTRLATPAVQEVESGSNGAVVSVTPDASGRAGDYVLCDVSGVEHARVASAGAAARAATLLPVSSTAPRELALTFESKGFTSDPTRVSVPEPAANDQKPLVVTSDGLIRPDEQKVLSGTATANAEIEISVPGAGFDTTVEADENGRWSATLPLLTGPSYQQNVVAQRVDGSLVDLKQFDLTRDPQWSSLKVDVQNRTADSVRLAVTEASPGTFSVLDSASKQVAQGTVRGGETATVDIPVGADAVDFVVVFTADNGAERRASVSVQAFDADAEYKPVTLTSQTAYTTGDEVVLSGTGTPGATVTANVPGHGFEDSTTVERDGTWSISVGYLHAGGFDGNSIVQTSETGTNTIRFSLTSAVEFTAPAKDSTVKEKRPTFAGTGQKGDIVTVQNAGGTTIATTTVRADGTWKADSTVDLPNGKQTVTVDQAPTS